MDKLASEMFKKKALTVRPEGLAAGCVCDCFEVLHAVHRKLRPYEMARDRKSSEKKPILVD